MNVINPATKERITTYDETTENDVQETLDNAEAAYESWRDRSIREREKLLANAAEIFRENKQQYSSPITKEMGKPISQSRAEVENGAVSTMQSTLQRTSNIVRECEPW